MNPKISIIIPCKNISEYTRQCIEACLELEYSNYEILVLPDTEAKMSFSNTKVVCTGSVGPSKKRNIGASQATGELLAFIDDDAFPDKIWLRKAVKYFNNEEIAAVGGPAITPKNEPLLQKAGGCVYESFLGGGSVHFRYTPKKYRGVNDYPSCNFIVRKSVFDRLNGFSTDFWPGEDTVFCLRITNDLKKKIVYDPDVLIYHHRRRLFLPHLEQVWQYAVHRGYFVKKFPETSLKPIYFLPSLFVLGIFFAPILSFLNPLIKKIFYIGVFTYLGVLLVFSTRPGLKLIPLVFSGIVLTHIVYGLGFLKGFLTKDLKR